VRGKDSLRSRKGKRAIRLGKTAESLRASKSGERRKGSERRASRGKISKQLQIQLGQVKFRSTRQEGISISYQNPYQKDCAFDIHHPLESMNMSTYNWCLPSN